jgi:hypothetical protein
MTGRRGDGEKRDMRILIAFGLLFMGVMIGFLISSLFTGSKLFELSEQISFQKSRADELAEKLIKMVG